MKFNVSKNISKLIFLVFILFCAACIPPISKVGQSGSSGNIYGSTDSKNILDPNKIVADDKVTTCASFESKEDCLNADKSHGLVCEFNVICLPRIYNENLGMKQERIQEMTLAYFEENNSPEKMGVKKYNLAKKDYELFALLTSLENKKDEVYAPIKAYLYKEFLSVKQKIRDLDDEAKEQKKIAEEKEIQRLKNVVATISIASADDLNQLMLDVKKRNVNIIDYRLLLGGTSKQLIEGLFIRAKDLNIKIEKSFTSKVVDDVFDFYNGGSGIAKWEYVIDDESLKTAEDKNKELLEALFCSDDELIKNEVKKLFFYSDKKLKGIKGEKSKITFSFIQKLKKIAKIKTGFKEILITFVSKSDKAFKEELRKFINQEPDILNGADKKFAAQILTAANQL